MIICHQHVGDYELRTGSGFVGGVSYRFICKGQAAPDKRGFDVASRVAK